MDLNVGLQYVTTNIDNKKLAWPQPNDSGEDRVVGYVSKTF